MHSEEEDRSLPAVRALLTRCVVGYALLFLIFRALGHLLPYQLLSPPVTEVHSDLGEWLFKASGLSYWLVQNRATALLFTLTLMGTGTLALFFPLRRGWVMAFSVLYFLLSLGTNVFLTHGVSYNYGLVWTLAAFWPRSHPTFLLLWQGVRYYACWIFASTFLMKAWHGALWQWDGGILLAKSNLADYLFHFPDTLAARAYRALLAHPWLINAGHKVAVLAEGTFLLGFFTRRFDRLLIVLHLFIQVSIYLFADVFFAELLVLVLPFVPYARWARYVGKRAPVEVAATPPA